MAIFKTLAQRCKEKAKRSAQLLVDSKERFIEKEIDYNRVQKQLKDLQGQLTDARMQREDTVATATTDATSIAATWRPCGTGFIELLSGENVDDYAPWAYAICEKLKTDAPIYVTEKQCVAYTMSKMKSSLFDNISA